jgi:serine/threonine protein kinase
MVNLTNLLEQYEALRFFVDTNPELRGTLEREDLAGIRYIDDKCVILGLGDNLVDSTHSLKYVVNPMSRAPLDDGLSGIVLQGLECQSKCKDLSGVQDIESPYFHAGIRGLIRLPYVQGTSLHRARSNPGLRGNPTKVLSLFRQFEEETLTPINERSIIQRDVKPGNLIYNGQKLILIDWSIACQRELYKMDRAFGRIMGTLGYFQTARQDRSIDPFALGMSVLSFFFPEAELQSYSTNPELFIDLHTEGLNTAISTEVGSFFKELLEREPLEEKKSVSLSKEDDTPITPQRDFSPKGQKKSLGKEFPVAIPGRTLPTYVFSNVHSSSENAPTLA